MLNFFKNISQTELIILAVLLVVFFGSKTIIGLGRTGGETLREVKKIKKSFTDAIDDDGQNKKGVSK